MHLIGDMATASLQIASTTLAQIVRAGLGRTPKQLPPWLFYDEAGSLLFEEITFLPEYYLTRLEREIFASRAGEMIGAAAGGDRLRLIELGAGSADKTRTLLAAALDYQGTVCYQPVDVSGTALEAARERIERELPEVRVEPLVADYTTGWGLGAAGSPDERAVLLWIGSSIGNFDPAVAEGLLSGINQTMAEGDGLLLGVDLAPEIEVCGGKTVEALESAYCDAAGVTEQFNKNMLVRLNRELGADFDSSKFAHRAIWNAADSRMEMHLESLGEQSVWIAELGMDVRFSSGERLHTENSYKYTVESAVGLMGRAGFPVVERWMDRDGWFAVFLGRKA